MCVGAGEAYDEPRLTCWYGALPYTYSRSTMAANAQVSRVIKPRNQMDFKEKGTLCLLVISNSFYIGFYVFPNF